MHIQFDVQLQCIQISTRINSSSVHTYIFVFVSFETYPIFNIPEFDDLHIFSIFICYLACMWKAIFTNKELCFFKQTVSSHRAQFVPELTLELI